MCLVLHDTTRMNKEKMPPCEGVAYTFVRITKTYLFQANKTLEAEPVVWIGNAPSWADVNLCYEKIYHSKF